MARSNPTWIPHTWTDVCDSPGRLHEQRLFARAYRSLPDGRYKRLTGNGLDRNIWISRTEKSGAAYAYAANLNWWKPEVTLRFAGGTQVHDCITDKPVPLADGAWTFTMAPYSLQSFRLTGGGLSSAESRIPAKDRAYVEKQIRTALAQAQAVLTEAKRREDECKDTNGGEALAELEGRVAAMKTALVAGDLAGAYTLITGALPMARDTIARILRGQTIRRAWW
jgi:hypothetical protein